MKEEDFNKNLKEGKVFTIPGGEKTFLTPEPKGESLITPRLETYLPFLELLRQRSWRYGSIWEERAIQIIVFDFTDDTATGDGKFYFHIDKRLDLMNLVDVHAEVITAGTTNTLDIQIHNLTDAVDMLSTKLTIDTGETGSDTAATPAVIDKDNDDVAENDVLRIDIDAVHTTPAKGLIITLGFRLP